MRFPKFRKGQMAVVMTLAIATLLGAMALSTDVGVMYYNWMQLQKAADASALAGATYFLTQNSTQTLPTPAINAACTYPTQQQNVACTYALNNFAQQPGRHLCAGAEPPGECAGGRADDPGHTEAHQHPGLFRGHAGPQRFVCCERFFDRGRTDSGVLGP
jgi:putative Flp pilus-assembly TadE/G-like protein